MQREIIMLKMSRNAAIWLRIESERGVTAIEYGLLASLVALAIIVGATLLGTKLNDMFNVIAGKVS